MAAAHDLGEDGKLYITIGERQEETRAQDLMDHGGKVIRLNEDGSVPADNPFIGNDAVLPEIFAYGIRSPQGWPSIPGPVTCGKTSTGRWG